MNKDSNKEANNQVVKTSKPVNSSEITESPLTAMGINNPSEIVRYSLRSEGDKDELKIYYRRRKGSLFPVSRKYKFGRSLNTIVTDSGKPEYAETYDISPFLLEAVEELNKIVKPLENSVDGKKEILDEIDRLEKTFTSKLDDLRAQIEKL